MSYDDNDILNDDDAVVLGEDEGEFRTEQVVYIDGDYYHVDANGGARGAWQNGKTHVTSIDVTEAKRLLLEMGYSPSDVLKRIRGAV